MSEDTIVVGIDIGTDSTKVVLGATGDWACEIVRNPVGGHTTPTMVAFDGALRHLGVNAKSKRNAVQHLNRFLDQHELVEELAQFYTVQHQCSNPDGPVVVANLEYNHQTRDFTGAALMGMLLGQIQTDVSDTLARRSSLFRVNNTLPLTFCISSPPDWTETAQQQLLDAAYAAGIDNTLLVDRGQAYMAAYLRKFPNHANKTLLLVDMGHAETTLALWGPKTADSLPNDQDNQGEEQNSNPEETTTPTLLACRRQKGLGAGMVDAALWHHFQSNTPQLQGLTQPSRGGQRLLAGMNKLKHLLSQLPEATVTVENLVNDQDFNLAAHRTLLEEVCQAQIQLLTNAIQQILPNKTLDAVEVVGGACRIPCFQQAIQEATQSTLSFSLDDTSAALGATLLAVDQAQTTTAATVGPAQMALRQAEQEMAALDRDRHQRAALLNQLEAHILELQAARNNSQHADLLQHPQLLDYLTQVEDWMFSQEAQDATTEQLAQKLEQTKAQTDEWTKEYRAALEEEQRIKEAELERQAQQAQLERNGQEEEEDDHDNRRLPKKRRMEIVMKNKKEGGELFSDGNYKFAAARYAKALSHCAKFVDLSPDDIQEVNAVKLTLNLNLALAYLKLQKPEQALRCCNDALALDDQHTKALYRRASVYYEQKNWEAASKDLKKARKQEPEDKAISKLQERVDAQIKRQQLKEKKMAKKMFG